MVTARGIIQGAKALKRLGEKVTTFVGMDKQLEAPLTYLRGLVEIEISEEKAELANTLVEYLHTSQGEAVITGLSRALETMVDGMRIIIDALTVLGGG